MIKYNNSDINSWDYNNSDIVKTYYHNIPCFQKAVLPSLKWVTFSNGDTIPSDLQIYGMKGFVNDLARAFTSNNDDIYVEDETHNRFGVHIGGYYYGGCYSETGIALNTSVEYVFSNIGCSDSYTVSNQTITYMSNNIQLLIYA